LVTTVGLAKSPVLYAEHPSAGDEADDEHKTVDRAGSEAEFVSLFDGENLDGWRKAGGGATYAVEDGCIVGRVGPGPNTFLRTEATYRNFVFRVQVKLDVPGNSGIQFRSHQRDGHGRVYGYQAEIDPSPRRLSA
jgi:hypothetical protein